MFRLSKSPPTSTFAPIYQVVAKIPRKFGSRSAPVLSISTDADCHGVPS